MKFNMFTFIGGFYDINDNNKSQMWIALFVVAHVSCMHIVLYVKENPCLEEIYFSSSQSMYNWGFQNIQLIIPLQHACSNCAK